MWSSRSSALLIALFAGVAGGCDEGSPVRSCPPCAANESCYDFTCVAVCSQATDCAPGRTCVMKDAGGRCLCDQASCGARQECTREVGSCQPVECGFAVDCENELDVCDRSQRRCFPSNGDCAKSAICPTFGADVQAIAAVQCDASRKLCKIERRPTELAFLQAERPMTLTAPALGAAIAAPASPRIEWNGPPGVPVIVVVLDAIPRGEDELREHTIWGVARAGAQAPSARWEDGRPVSGGQWTAATPAPLASGVYYVLAQAVSGGRLVAKSELRPFWVGAGTPWKREGEACKVEGVPGDCDSPFAPLACSKGRCRRLCASHDVDCGGRFCLPPEGLPRFCEL